MRHLSASVLIAGSACWLDFVGHFDAQNSAFGGLLNARTASAMVAQGHEGTKIGVKYGFRLDATSAISYLIYSILGKTRRLNFDLTPIPPGKHRPQERPVRPAAARQMNFGWHEKQREPRRDAARHGSKRCTEISLRQRDECRCEQCQIVATVLPQARRNVQFLR